MEDEFYTIEKLTDNRKEEWLQHVTQVFSNTPRAYFERHLDNDPNAKLEDALIAIDKKTGKIISTVRIVVRKMNLFNQNKRHVVSFGGIAEVSTKPEYRGKKLASKLLEKAKEVMKEKGLLVSGLHTGEAVPLYHNVGWRSALVVGGAFQLASEENSSYNDYKLRKINWEQDLAEIKVIFVEFLTHYQLQGTFARNKDDYWNTWVKNEIGEVLVAEKEGKLVGLAGWKLKNELKYVTEAYCSCSLIQETERGPLLKHILQRALFTGKEESQLVVAHSFYAKLLGVQIVKEMTDKGAMYAVIDSAELKKQAGIKSSDQLAEVIVSTVHTPLLTDGY